MGVGRGRRSFIGGVTAADIPIDNLHARLTLMPREWNATHQDRYSNIEYNTERDVPTVCLDHTSDSRDDIGRLLSNQSVPPCCC